MTSVRHFELVSSIFPELSRAKKTRKRQKNFKICREPVQKTNKMHGNSEKTLGKRRENAGKTRKIGNFFISGNFQQIFEFEDSLETQFNFINKTLHMRTQHFKFSLINDHIQNKCIVCHFFHNF